MPIFDVCVFLKDKVFEVILREMCIVPAQLNFWPPLPFVTPSHLDIKKPALK